MTSSWGWQLIVDCFGCPERACCDLDHAYEFLEAICRELGMTKQTQPYVFKTCETAYPGRPGLSGWVPIIESGIQLHTSSNNSFVSVDVYSCKAYDRARVESFVSEWFGAERFESVLVERGKGLSALPTTSVQRFEP